MRGAFNTNIIVRHELQHSLSGLHGLPVWVMFRLRDGTRDIVCGGDVLCCKILLEGFCPSLQIGLRRLGGAKN